MTITVLGPWLCVTASQRFCRVDRSSLDGCQWFDRKSVRIKPAKLAETLVAMGNAEGGDRDDRARERDSEHGRSIPGHGVG